MDKKPVNVEQLNFQRDNKPLGDCGCPMCGAVNASHEGNVLNDGVYVGDAWNCNECLTDFWCHVEGVVTE